MARVKTDWTIEGPDTDSRGRPMRGIIGRGSTTGDVEAELRKMYEGQADLVLSVTVSADTRVWTKHVDERL
jgi:hypothetical protein